jgi:2-polyprenyl-6-methoxyphenol hydroxylase-like FAD-dependent oxidoreductase
MAASGLQHGLPVDQTLSADMLCVHACVTVFKCRDPAAPGGVQRLSYDLLVGADGAASSVKSALAAHSPSFQVGCHHAQLVGLTQPLSPCQVLHGILLKATTAEPCLRPF